MQKYYFFKTVKIEGRPRLRPLDNQVDTNGAPIASDLNVQADSIMRGNYPIGTVFGSESLELRTHSSTPFYSAGAIYPIGLSLGSYIAGSHIPPKDMTDAYNDFITNNVSGLFGNSTEPLHAEESGQDQDPARGKTCGDAVTMFEKISTDSALSGPTIDRDGFYVDAPTWRILVRNAMKKVSTLITGPTGSGKTEIIMLLARKLGLECNVYDMGSMHDPLSQMLGVHRLVNGSSVFDFAKFTQDIQKPGIIVLDEVNRAPAGTDNILFPCLDSRRTLPVEMAGGNDMRGISIHPDCVFFATANIGHEYTGTQKNMDRALTGRFFNAELDYMPCTEEAKVLKKRCGISANDAANIVSVAETVRNLYRKQEISCSLSTRETLMAGGLVSDGWSALEAMQIVFLPLFDGTIADGERSIVSKIFMTR